MDPKSHPIEPATFSVACSKCGVKAQVSVNEQRPSISCPACANAIDLTTDEAKHARQSASAKASIQTHQEIKK